MVTFHNITQHGMGQGNVFHGKWRPVYLTQLLKCQIDALPGHQEIQYHCSDLITSATAYQITACLNFFAQPVVQAQIKENIKAHWPLGGNPPVTGSFPPTKGQ